jgi:ADP-dependent NAD(P)H-hydrate dehydratase
MSEPTPVTADYLRTIPLPSPASDADKEARGRIMVVGGSAEVPGALSLAGEAALRAGAGKLQLATPQSVSQAMAIAVPEARVFGLDEHGGEIWPDGIAAIEEAASHCDAVLIGPGMIDKTPACEVAARLLAVHGPGFVIDAAAMAGCWDRPELTRPHGGRVILTPHAGEVAGLSGKSKEEIEADPLMAAREAAERLQAVVMVKGERTFVAAPDGRGWAHAGGSAGLGTSGSGDVLAGIIAGLLARGASPETAALWGIFLHGQAGQRLSQSVGPFGFLARELSPEVPGLMAEFAE